MDDEQLRERLSPEQYHVTQQCGTEAPFTGKYWNSKQAGVYRCVVCGAGLFSSDRKYDSGSGWPSFTLPVSGKAVAERIDRSHAMVRTEVTCGGCGAHLGHVFPDGPEPEGSRYCINSAALDLQPQAAEGGKLLNSEKAEE